MGLSLFAIRKSRDPSAFPAQPWKVLLDVAGIAVVGIGRRDDADLERVHPDPRLLAEALDERVAL